MNPQEMTSKIIEKVRDHEIDRRQEAIEEKEYQFDLPAAFRWFKANKKWYCRKNQPKNYIRLVCHRPTDVSDHKPFWICRLQVFGGKYCRLIDDIRITAEAYERFPVDAPGWSEKVEKDFFNDYRIYSNPILNK